MNRTVSTRPRDDGFTLTELLVVIATLAVLAVVVLPALAAAKPKDLTANCISNLRKWGLAQQLYSSDNKDAIPYDGTVRASGQSNYGQYAGDNPWTAPAGIYFPGQPSFDSLNSASPYDGYAWFNTLPQLVADKPLAFYYYNNGALASVDVKFPVPGNGKGKIWICPATQYSIAADKAAWYDAGKYGIFSYVMGLDLKFRSSVCNGVGGNGPLWGTQWTKTTSVRHPSAQVFMFDVKASPTLENATPRGGSYPAARWNSFSGRHGNGSVIQFLDGHAALIRCYSVTNNTGVGCASQENMNNSAIWWNPNRDK